MLLWILGMAGVFGQRGLMGSVQEAYQAAEAEVSIQTDTKESRRLALTFDDDVIIGLSQEISYKEAVSMI